MDAGVVGGSVTVLASHALHTQADRWIWAAGLATLLILGGAGLLYVWHKGRP
jgi:hypothetical protein